MTVYVAWRCAHGHSGIVEDSIRVFATPENVLGFWQAERSANGLRELPEDLHGKTLSSLRERGEAECIVVNSPTGMKFDHARKVEVDEFYNQAKE